MNIKINYYSIWNVTDKSIKNKTCNIKVNKKNLVSVFYSILQNIYNIDKVLRHLEHYPDIKKGK